MTSTSTLTIFGIDYGTKKIGVSVGQTLTNTAMGIAVIPCKDLQADWDQLDALVKRWKPGAFVVGLPFNMDATENDMTGRAKKFSAILEERYQLPVHHVDERLSTREAREITRENAGRAGKKYNDRAKVDAMAAQLLLESWFSSQ